MSRACGGGWRPHLPAVQSEHSTNSLTSPFVPGVHSGREPGMGTEGARTQMWLLISEEEGSQGGLLGGGDFSSR